MLKYSILRNGVGMLFLMLPGFAMADPTGIGVGHQGLSQAIAKRVADTMDSQNIVGMTVAVSRNGKLLLSRGYGNARKSGVKVTKMTRSHRTPIGSVSKAAVSGPTLWASMKHKNVSPNSRLYGSEGVLKGTSNDDMAIARAKFQSIVGFAISPNDIVYAWGMDGKVRRGSSRNLDKHDVGKRYTVAPGKGPEDIVAMAMSKSGKVYTWYIDGTRSIGTPIDLDSHGAPTSVTYPGARTASTVIGAAIRKSDDRVYMWYENGHVSAGTSRKPGSAIKQTPFSTASELLRHEMVGLGLSKKSNVYVWYANNRMTAGTSVDLDKKIKLRNYSPPLSAFRTGDTYTDITIQHLLDHKSGFRGSGDVSGAASMYGVQAKNLDYEDVHAHFLRRGPMQSLPGAEYSYSNHGFGMTTILIEAITDRSYTDVTQNSYLNWVGVRGKVVPRSTSQTGLDTDLFDVTGNGIKKRKPSNSGLGLAAGGWLSSAENLLRITNKLAKAYSVDEIDRMGWGSSGTSNRKLSHSGATGGGEAYVVIFTDGYTSHAGLDLSDIHVAVATNTGNVSGAALRTLADQVAKAVPKTNVPQSYNAW